MNLPQVGSVIVIFSLVILLGFGFIGIAEAAKASGVSTTEINSAKVCGDRLCDTPMTIEEKITEFRSESELVTRGLFSGITGTGMMTAFAGGLSGEVAGFIAGQLFDSIFPSGADENVEELLADMEDRLNEHLDKVIEEQTSILLGAMTDMQFSLVESMKEESTNDHLFTARTNIGAWHTYHKQYINYLVYNSDDSNDEKADELKGQWGKIDFQVDVISNLTDLDNLSQKLRVEGFPLYWMGQLLFIAYSQDQALLANPESPNNTDHALNIKDTVAAMELQLKAVKIDAEEVRLSQITQVKCIMTSTDQVQENVVLKPDKVSTFAGVFFQVPETTLDSFRFENVQAENCWVEDLQTNQKFQGWSGYKWSLKGNNLCMPLYIANKLINEGEWQNVKTDACPSGSKLVAKPYVKYSDQILSWPVPLQTLKEKLEMNRVNMITTMENQLYEQFLPYDDAMKDLENLKTTPIPNTTTPSDSFIPLRGGDKDCTPGPNKDLSYCDLSGADLYVANLTGANLEGAVLRGATLTGANLSNANLSGADLSGANLYVANFEGADLAGANFEGAVLRGATLSNANLFSVNLSNSNLEGADLRGATLTGADLSGADLTNADLTNANLSGADLSFANLRFADLNGADLSGADLTNADLSRANLSDANFEGAITLRCTGCP